MTINIALSDLKYRYDVYQMFNLFYPFNELIFQKDNWNYEVEVKDDGFIIRDKEESKEFFIENTNKVKEELKKAVYIFLRDKTGKVFPWGTLVGIRPSKIALSLLNEGKSKDEIVDYFYKHNLTNDEKTNLCIKVAEIEKRMVNKDKNTISLYIGMPFCPTRCLYCSFASNPIVSCKKIVEPYIQCLIYEIEKIGIFIRKKNLKVETVYFGGGTPTAVNDEQFEYIMKNIYNKLICGNNIKEFTVECGRPDSLNQNKFLTMKKYHVDRISINPQTMNEDTLKLIGRNHTVSDVIEKFKMAREFGFNNINMDIIVGLPKEGLSHIKNTCKEIFDLKPDSLTVHGLSVKRGSRLHQNMKDHLQNIHQNELNLMYKETSKLAESLGMEPYYMYRQKNMMGNMENVGYSLAGMECIYNIQMIEERQTIIAMGADAVSKVVFLDENRIERVPNVKDVIEYNKRIDEMIERKAVELNKLY